MAGGLHLVEVRPWLVPSAAWVAAAAAVISVLLPLLVQPLMTGVDLRARTHAAALARFYLDALIGLIPIRTHGAQRALQNEHEQQLGQWVRASLDLQRRAVAMRAIIGVTSLGMVVAILQAFVFSLLTMVYIGEALEEAH